MATDLVLVSATSNEIIFSGNMYKAPPLDRKKRKRWHERFFVLRANRTLELYKSLKAAESHKAPRRIIDLRECISLEVGLEYKNYEHILSLGTFKRTFFFAAPSDALMLQWANVLEKTKSAQDGESIEVLDIGLRKTSGIPIVQRVKPSSPAQRFSGSPKRSLHKAIDPKGTLSVGNFPRDSSESIPFRGSDAQERSSHLEKEGASSRQRTSSLSSSYESSSNRGSQKSRPKSPHRVPLLLKPQLSSDSFDSQSSHSEVGRSSRPTSQSSQQSFIVSPSRTSSSGQAALSPLVSTRIPPPANILAPAARTKDGFFIVDNRNSGHSETGESRDSKSDAAVDKSKGKHGKHREFVEREGALQRFKPGKNAIKVPKSKPINEKKAERNPQGLSNKFLAMRSTPMNDLSTASNFDSNMKRSFRYRMITLRPEKPIFVDNGEENSDSEDEREEALGETKKRQKAHVSLSRKKPVDQKSPHSSPKRQARQNTTEPTQQSEEEELDTKPIEVSPRPTPLPRIQPRSNGYSRVKVMGAKKTQSTDFSIGVPRIIAAKLNVKPRKRSNSQSDAMIPSVKDQMLHMTSLSQDDILYEDTISDNAAAAQMITGMSLEEVDVFDIPPALPPSNGFMYTSMTSLNSLDNILVEPPPMFSEGNTATEDAGTNTQLDSPGVKVQADKPSFAEKDLRQQETSVVKKKPIPKERKKRDNHQAQQHRKLDEVFIPPVVDRSSTESNDTGYTSTSPSCATEDKDTSEAVVQEFSLKFEDDYDADHEGVGAAPSLTAPMGGSGLDRGRPTGFEKQSSLQLSQASLTSTLSDYVRLYSPLIFYKPGGAKSGSWLSLNRSSPTTAGSNVFVLQICLAEDSDEIIKDLIAFKAQEGFTVVECDEIEGSKNVSTIGDDFTVETSLEDLEFGFTVIKSTQKVGLYVAWLITLTA